MEHLNDTFDTKFFRTTTVRLTQASSSTATTPSRPSTTPATVTCALKGATPNQVEARAGFTPQLPSLTSDIPPDFTDLSGQVEWIWLIRSDRKLRVLDRRFTMPDGLTYEEVTATLIVEDQELVVTHQDREISRHPYPLR